MVNSELVAVLWNGRAGGASRRIYVHRVYRVTARRAGNEDADQFWTLPSMERVEACIGWLQRPRGVDLNDGWRDITDAFRTE